MQNVAVVENQRASLEKLEHRINLSIRNAAQNMANILIALKEIRDNKYYLLRNCRSLREYIIKMDYMKRLNLHISSIFLKLQLIDYGNKYQLDYFDIQDIGEAKMKLLVQTDKEIGKDITVDELKKKKLIELENNFRSRNVSSDTTDSPERKKIIFDIEHFKEVLINDKDQEIIIKINKTVFNKYLNDFKEVEGVRFGGVRY